MADIPVRSASVAAGRAEALPEGREVLHREVSSRGQNRSSPAWPVRRRKVRRTKKPREPDLSRPMLHESSSATFEDSTSSRRGSTESIVAGGRLHSVLFCINSTVIAAEPPAGAAPATEEFGSSSMRRAIVDRSRNARSRIRPGSGRYPVVRAPAFTARLAGLR